MNTTHASAVSQGLSDDSNESTDVGPTGERSALAWAHTARFLTTASQLRQLPLHGLPEIAFVGRSNAGKSTAINTIGQQRQLAFASRKPGRTQHINLFRLGPDEDADPVPGMPRAVWADLPGYGYAAVERSAKLRWQKVMADYLEGREGLTGIVQMVDSRHGFTPLDRQLLDFIGHRVWSGQVKLLVLLTKSDKLTRQESTLSLRKARELLGEWTTEEADIGVALFSSLQRRGVTEAAETLREWAQAAPALSQSGESEGPSDEGDSEPPELQEQA